MTWNRSWFYGRTPVPVGRSAFDVVSGPAFARLDARRLGVHNRPHARRVNAVSLCDSLFNILVIIFSCTWENLNSMSVPQTEYRDGSSVANLKFSIRPSYGGELLEQELVLPLLLRHITILDTCRMLRPCRQHLLDIQISHIEILELLIFLLINQHADLGVWIHCQEER